MEWVWLLGIGLLAGILSALLGVGGGILMTPTLHYIFHFSWTASVGISLFAIAIQSPIGVWQHARRGHVNWRLGAILAVSGALGVWAGDWILPRTPTDALKGLFAAAILLAAWRMVQAVEVKHHDLHMSAVAGLGAVTGVLSRILGIGGGLVTVPALTLQGVGVHIAIASSLIPVFTNAAMASGANLARDVIMWPGAVLGGAAVLGAPIGAKIAHHAKPIALQRIFAGGLVAMACLLAWDALT